MRADLGRREATELLPTPDNAVATGFPADREASGGGADSRARIHADEHGRRLIGQASGVSEFDADKGIRFMTFKPYYVNQGRSPVPSRRYSADMRGIREASGSDGDAAITETEVLRNFPQKGKKRPFSGMELTPGERNLIMSFDGNDPRRKHVSAVPGSLLRPAGEEGAEDANPSKEDLERRCRTTIEKYGNPFTVDVLDGDEHDDPLEIRSLRPSTVTRWNLPKIATMDFLLVIPNHFFSKEWKNIA